jgi:hypothetical protein
MSPLLPSVLALLAVTQVAEAREYGAIQGRVTDDGGLPLPNAEVILYGAELAGERKALTRDDGVFRFELVPPGDYDVAVQFNGARVARAEVRVALQTTTNVELRASLGAVSEEVEVVGFKPVVDTRSSSFSTSLDEEQFQNLPVGRSYQDVVNTIPGVTGRYDSSEGGVPNTAFEPSVRGEGQYGNNYMIDGVSTRDPATKGSGQDLNFDAIQSIQVYTDGAPAEFSQFTGMAVNIVTKDGGDEHHGSAAVFYSQHAWFDDSYPIFQPGSEPPEEVDTIKQRFRAPRLALTAGGPIALEKLWYFTSLDLLYDWLVPEGVELSESGDEASEAVGGRFLGKLTWFPSRQWTLRYVFNGEYTSSQNVDAGATVLPEATYDQIDFTQAHLLTATFAPDDKNTLEIRGGYSNVNLDALPSSRDELTPARLDNLGVLHDNSFDFDYNNRNRLGGSIIYTRFLEEALGDHEIRGGGEYYFLQSQRELLHTGRTTIQWIDTGGVPDPAQPAVDVGSEYHGGTLLDASGNPVDLPCLAEDYSDCAFREHWTNVGELGNNTHTFGAFVQDTWQPQRWFTVNAGFRLDLEQGLSSEGNKPITQLPSEFPLPFEEREVGTFGPTIMPAPRIGLALDPFDDGTTKVTGHYGWYYDLAGGNFWDWANESSANGFVRYRNDLSGDADPWVWNNTQDPVANPLIYAEDLLPARQEKINVGIEREIAQDLAIGVRGILSTTKNIPEDIDVDLFNFYIMNSPIKERNYRALEFTLNKQFDETWQVYGAYTLQESYGHTPGQFELAPGADSGSDGNAVGVYLDDIGERSVREANYEVGTPNSPHTGANIFAYGLKGLGRYSITEEGFYDEAGWYGYLPYHSFHAIKLNGSYTAPFGTTFGLVYEFDSGHAWQKKTLVPFYGYDGFAQGRGGRMMPAVHYVDFRVAHLVEISEDQSFEVSIDIFNLPGFAESITYFENDAPGFGLTLYRQTPRSVRLGVKFRY